MRATDAALLIVALVIAWSIYRAHKAKGEYAAFNLLDILMDGGKVSRIACAFMTTLIVTSWVIIRLTLDKKLTEIIFAAYGTMWVAPIVAKLFSTPPAAPPVGTVTTDTLTHTKETKKGKT